MQFEVDFFKKEDGSCPIRSFLDSLSTKMRTKVMRMIWLLQNNGYELREPYSKHLEDGLFELRIKHSTMSVRVFYFFIVGQKIILTNGFTKKTMKTPRSEIELAKKYREQYIKREEKKHGRFQ